MLKKIADASPPGWRGPRLYKCVDGSFAHYWKVDSPSGSKYARGVCRLCGRKRLFRTSWSYGFYNGKQEAWDRRREEVRRRRRKKR